MEITKNGKIKKLKTMLSHHVVKDEKYGLLVFYDTNRKTVEPSKNKKRNINPSLARIFLILKFILFLLFFHSG